jgi:transcriptional regulator of acetoin/glycerol metabolism
MKLFMIDNTIDNDIIKLYNLFEVKLEFIADNILLSKTNNNENILLNIQAVIEKVFIVSAMKISNGNISKASKLLGINRNTLSKKLKELKAVNYI